MLLGRTYLVKHGKDRMRSPTDLASAREAFLRDRPSNLDFLLETRYSWMNEYLPAAGRVVELGAGAGLSREYLRPNGLLLTEYTPATWIDMRADALRLPFASETIDVVVCVNVVHHFSNSIAFLNEACRVLKPGGLLVVFEPSASLCMRLILRLMRHEGWSFEVDVFSPTAVLNDVRDPWSGNNAVADLLFEDSARFEARVPTFKILRNELCECLLFLCSGGVTAKVATINLPRWMLKRLSWLDARLSRLAPSIFALGRRVVLEKSGPAPDGRHSGANNVPR